MWARETYCGNKVVNIGMEVDCASCIRVPVCGAIMSRPELVNVRV